MPWTVGVLMCFLFCWGGSCSNPQMHPLQTLSFLFQFQEPSDTCLDWRGEFLQVIQEAFEKEREMLMVELQPQLCGSGPRAHGALVERLQKVVQEQVNLVWFTSELSPISADLGTCL